MRLPHNLRDPRRRSNRNSSICPVPFVTYPEPSLEKAELHRMCGPSLDGKRQFEYVADPHPMGEVPELDGVDPRLHGTPKIPVPPVAS